MLLIRKQKWHILSIMSRLLIFSTDILGGLNLARAWSHRLCEAWLASGWLKVDLQGDVKVFLTALSQYNLNCFYLAQTQSIV